MGIKKYFKSLDGFFVKDEDARNDISLINTSIETINENIQGINNSIGIINTNIGLLEGKLDSIVESGSNENGNYIKYSDGTMICTKSISGSINFSTEWYGLYYGSLDLGNYPATFIERPKLSVQFYGSNSQWVIGMTNATASHIASINVCKPNQVTAMGYYDIIAIGKWKE